jgi:hypothetical protein
MFLRLVCPALVALLFLAPARASAQETAPDPFTTARFRFGGFALTPGVKVTNLGYDSNVFNEWSNPRGDFTLTITPQTDAWLRLGKARVAMHGALGYVYFATYEEECSWNTDDSIRLEFPFVHVRPYAGLTYLNIRDRPGYEIDVRVRRSETGGQAGVDFPITRKTTIGIGFKQVRTDYAEGESFRGNFLRVQYNRETTRFTGSLRYALTPLTTLLVEAERIRERFDYVPGRDSNGFRLVPGVEFKPFALISGSARVGYRKLNMIDPKMPDYSGAVAAVNLGYTLLGATRVAVTVNRDIEYSYELLEPYYVLTGTVGTITRRLTSSWDLQGRYGTQRLAYRTAIDPAGGSQGGGPIQATQGRTDTVRFYGGGIGYRTGTDVRIGFDIDYYSRRSDRVLNQYEGIRAGTSVTYGF